MPHRARLLAVALVLSLAAACGSDDPEGGTPQSGDATTTSEATGAAATDVSDEPAYAEAGPYVAGTTTLTAPDGRAVEVWYPADPGAEEGAEQDVFEITDLLPENLKAIVPPELNPSYPTDAHRDIDASADGPFPVLVFSHGFAAYPTMYQFLTTHLASWGIVVVAPDHRERGLLAALGGARTEVDDTEVLLTARDTALAASADEGALLGGTMDPSRQATAGHSAGTFAAVQGARRTPTSTRSSRCPAVGASTTRPTCRRSPAWSSRVATTRSPSSTGWPGCTRRWGHRSDSSCSTTRATTRSTTSA